MSVKENLSSGEKSKATSGTSSPPSGDSVLSPPGGEAPTSAAAPGITPAATVFVPANRQFSVDVDAQYPYCTYKEH